MSTPTLTLTLTPNQVRTLSGNQFFMHGVGVFDYASIPNVITTQVYMCPFAPCTADMMEMGECLTFIQAVAVKLEKVRPTPIPTPTPTPNPNPDPNPHPDPTSNPNPNP